MLSEQELQSIYTEGRLRLLKPGERAEDTPPEPSDADSGRARIRHLYCESYDAIEPRVSKTTIALSEFIAQTAGKLGLQGKQLSAGALRRWLRERGEPGDRRERFMRDGRSLVHSASRLHPIVREILTAKIEEYWNGYNVSQEIVYCEVVTELAHLKATGQLGDESLSIHKSTVHRHIRRSINLDRARRRLGSREAKRLFSPVQGAMNAEEVLDTVVMDHTLLDVSVIDDERLLCIVHPWLTTAIDAYSRLPLGIYLGFEPPSILSTMACLRHVLRPKVEVSEVAPRVTAPWDAFGVPDELVVDNGWDFAKTSFQDACAEAGISVRRAPVAAPEYQGIAERFFGTLNQNLVHRLPGGLPHTPQRRHELGIEMETEATLLLSELRAAIYECIVCVYGRAPIRTLRECPLERWRRGVERKGQPYCPDLAAVDRMLAKLAPTRTLTRQGIELHGLVYCSYDEVAGLLAALLPLQPARQRKGTAKVKVKYHPEDLGSILVLNPVSKSYVKLECTQQKYARGLSEHQHKAINEFKDSRQLAFQSEEERCIARSELFRWTQSRIPAMKIRDRQRAQRLNSLTMLPPAAAATLSAIAPMHGVAVSGIGDLQRPEKPARAAAPRKQKRRSAPPEKVPSPIAQPSESRSLNRGSSFEAVDFSTFEDAW